MIEGLNKALEIIKEEKKVAIKLNPQMAMGMGQIEMLIEKEIDKLKESQNS